MPLRQGDQPTATARIQEKLIMAQSSGRKKGLAGLWHNHPFHIHLATLFSVMIFLACAAIVWANHFQGQKIVLAAAENLFDRIHRESGNEIVALRAPLEAIVTVMRNAPVIDAESLDSRKQSLMAFAGVLKRDTNVSAAYVGYQNGDFFLVRALRNEAERRQFEAPRHAEYLLQSIERRDGATPRWILLDAALNTISESSPPGYTFDPRVRPWYGEAMKEDKVIVTAPYVFATTGNVGITVAGRAAHGRAVVGADMVVDQISKSLQKSRVTPSTLLAVYDAAGSVVAHGDPGRQTARGADGKPVLAKITDLSPVLGEGASHRDAYAKSTRATIDGRDWMMKIAAIGVEPGKSYQLAVAAPLDELLSESRRLLIRSLLIAILIVAATVPVSYWVARRIAGNLQALQDQAAAIRRFDFGEYPLPKTRINEVFGLGRAMREMRTTISKFLELTTALAGERKFDVLLNRVLKEANDAAGGKNGVVYLLENDGVTLKPAVQAWEAGTSDELPPSLLLTDTANPVAVSVRQPAISGVHHLPAERPTAMEYLNAHFGTEKVMMVTEQLRNRAGATVGVMCLFMAGNAHKPSQERLALVEAFAGAGAVAIDNQRLLLAQKALLESFIGLVAGAIDAKSPYTGGHCTRVPELTKMLAKAACDAKEGPFADFNINEDEWEALHIAGWLHDCGKVTTPEYVVDKATKLETIYDRIHEIRTRFEVLKRDAEIACLNAIVAGGNAAELRAALADQLRTLDDEFAFIATCNEGGEFMAPEKVEKLKVIGSRTWQRTLNDRIGVSWDEAKRMSREPAPELPATERLLADKAQHIIPRGPLDMMPEDNQWGFKLKVPAHLYNRGEIYNLSIARGTLTEEERYKINDHIMQTIIMLSRLPFPGALKAVPELAGGHHEKMDGTGYPKRLSRDQMSVQARIMAIADIFEALTASDRPYKKGKMLSEAIKIMSFMKKDAHVDADLFELFLTSGVYKDYARQFLSAEYIDEVDISVYLKKAA
jgi:HD-GYP domain-containing protein (c-di-GMP phosphodiesterase class II)